MGSTPLVAVAHDSRPETGEFQRVRLLVSVRNTAEAHVARTAGADWIDVKEPKNGPLGRADVETITGVLHAVGANCPVSAALGELLDFKFCDVTETVPAGLPIAKLGLAGCAGHCEWQSIWHKQVAKIPDGTLITPVIYADQHSACSPPLEQIIRLAIEARSKLVLIDTFDKRGKNLLGHFSLADLELLINRFREHDIKTVVAGSLTAADIECVALIRPFMVAVRTAACKRGRDSRISTRRVRRLASILHARQPA